MDIRIFTLRFNPATERFDDEQLRDFIKDKEVVSMSDHFFLRDGAPYLTMVIGFHPAPFDAEPAKGRKASNKRDESWRNMLKKNDWPLFNTMRTWRNETAERKGFPPYVICSNRELATVVVARPQSLNALGQIKVPLRCAIPSHAAFAPPLSMTGWSFTPFATCWNRFLNAV